MIVFLVRHGETRANLKEGELPELTSKGVEQGKLLADHFRNEDFDVIVSSDLDRALLNAREIMKYHKCGLIVDEDFREIYRVIVGGPPKKVWDYRLENDVKRVGKVWEKILSWNYDKVLVVCHGNLVRYFVSRASGKDLKKMWSVTIDNASITTLEIKNGKARLLSLNDTAHLKK